MLYVPKLGMEHNMIMFIANVNNESLLYREGIQSKELKKCILSNDPKKGATFDYYAAILDGVTYLLEKEKVKYLKFIISNQFSYGEIIKE